MLQSRQSYLLAKEALHHIGLVSQTGKTFKMLLDAREKAIAGKNVIIICASYMQANHFEELLTTNEDSPLFMSPEVYSRVKFTTSSDFYFKHGFKKFGGSPYIVSDPFAQDDLIRSLLQNCIDLQGELSELRDKQRRTQQLIGELIEIWGL